jgi:hypothetical protein
MEQEESDPGELTIFTVGHSNHDFAKFLGLLEQHQIAVLVDVRSQPFSRYVTHFNYPAIEAAIERHHIQYQFMGRELGGRPEGADYYDAEGYVLYGQVAGAAFFRKGIARLEELGAMQRVAIMCSEEDPTGCHRRLLIGRVLRADGVTIRHIRGDGQLQTEDDLTRAAAPPAPEHFQQSLWDTTDENADDTDAGLQEAAEWKSIRPVLRKKPPVNSSSPYDEQEFTD